MMPEALKRSKIWVSYFGSIGPVQDGVPLGSGAIAMQPFDTKQGVFGIIR